MIFLRIFALTALLTVSSAQVTPEADVVNLAAQFVNYCIDTSSMPEPSLICNAPQCESSANALFTACTENEVASGALNPTCQLLFNRGFGTELGEFLSVYATSCVTSQTFGYTCTARVYDVDNGFANVNGTCEIASQRGPPSQFNATCVEIINPNINQFCSNSQCSQAISDFLCNTECLFAPSQNISLASQFVCNSVDNFCGADAINCLDDYLGESYLNFCASSSLEGQQRFQGRFMFNDCNGIGTGGATSRMSSIRSILGLWALLMVLFLALPSAVNAQNYNCSDRNGPSYMGLNAIKTCFDNSSASLTCTSACESAIANLNKYCEECPSLRACDSSLDDFKNLFLSQLPTCLNGTPDSANALFALPVVAYCMAIMAVLVV